MDKELTDIKGVKYYRTKYYDGPTLGDILGFAVVQIDNNAKRHCNLVNVKIKQS